MKITKFIKIIPLAALALSVMALSARADDHDNDRHRKGGDRRHHSSRNQVEIGVNIPGIAVGVYAPRRHRTVIVEHERRYYESDSLGYEVQRALARNGYYYGPIDGDIGPGTRASIRAYQLDYGLTPTARISRELLVSLQLR